MKNIMKIITILLILLLAISCSQNPTAKPRVIIITDIQTDLGDPDDIQSLCHVLWYADELDIKAIIPEHYQYTDKRGGVATSIRVLEKYKADYYNPNNNFIKMKFPTPELILDSLLIKTREEAIAKIIIEATKGEENPLYLLLWGNMKILSDALRTYPQIVSNIRVLTIGTNVKDTKSNGDGSINNWNGQGRDEIFEDERFNKLWWIENDWGYNGMFSGLVYKEGVKGPIAGRPVEIMEEISKKGGELGKLVKSAVSNGNTPWARYFRAGDTPTVLYLIDPKNKFDNPNYGSWSGKFVKPFPKARPNYWTNEHGKYKWNYATPTKTWENADSVLVESYKFLLNKREEMYSSLISKIEKIYNMK